MKVKNYDLTCFSYASNPKKLEGSYIVSINLDNTILETYWKVKDPEKGLELIKNIIDGHDFEFPPDLKVMETNHLGRHIFAKHYERLQK